MSVTRLDHAELGELERVPGAEEPTGDVGSAAAAGPARILRLQQLFGNSAVTAMIQRACVLDMPPAPPGAGAGANGERTLAFRPPPPGVGTETPTVPDTGGVTPDTTGPTGTTGPAVETPPEVTVPETPGPGPEVERPPSVGPTGPGAEPAAGTPTAHPMIRRGSRGDAVREAQTKLNAKGASPPLAVDGIFGPLTDAATRAFQTTNAPPIDGIIGPITWAALDAGGGGGGDRPDPNRERQDLLAQTNIVVVDHGSSSAAVDVARQIQDEEWRSLDAPALRNIVGLTVELHIIPHDKKMTDLDEFKSLKGQTTFDGRLWDDVRGINMGRIGDKIISAVGEETLIDIPGQPAGYSLGFVASHESGHAVRSSFTPEQDAELVRIFNARVAAFGQPPQPTSGSPPEDNTPDDWLAPRWYTASNADEYLANSIAAFFTHPYSDDATISAKYTPSWLQANDPDMYALLQSVYAPGTVTTPAPTSP